jgi:hypothetical protein
MAGSTENNQAEPSEPCTFHSNEPKLLLKERNVDGKIQLVLAAVSVYVVAQHVIDVVANLTQKSERNKSEYIRLAVWQRCTSLVFLCCGLSTKLISII